MTKVSLEALLTTAPAQRILLLPHCLRPSQSCPGKQSKKGLVCPEDCREDCAVGRLKRAALELGYKGVCIAAGGSQALRYVAEQQPEGLVAVACDKELAEGVSAVREWARPGDALRAIVIIPLSRDGCVDTEVDEARVLEVLRAGKGTE